MAFSLVCYSIANYIDIKKYHNTTQRTTLAVSQLSTLPLLSSRVFKQILKYKTQI